ncbi:sulfotransferase 1C4-like [Portunus trituberculatus]|uniref:sulfotransferase 1C4-like n=1 Tax=Portunus trituberculatus TaxID=210409 RepID=UPI001E1CCCF2|nr:sulfotransferase 1C4-like [Portunus trituberculatus]
MIAASLQYSAERGRREEGVRAVCQKVPAAAATHFRRTHYTCNNFDCEPLTLSVNNCLAANSVHYSKMSRQLLSGHKVEQASEEEVKKMEMVPFVRGIVRILPEGWLYPWSATIFLDKIYNMKFRSDDVIVMTFPKCGTTWMQEIVWTMLHNPNLDNPEADESIWSRSHEIRSRSWCNTMPGNKRAEHWVYVAARKVKANMADLPWFPLLHECAGVTGLNQPLPGVICEFLSLVIEASFAKVSEVEVELYPRITEVQAEFHVRISDLQAEFCRKSSVSEGRLCPTVVYVARNPKDMMVSFYWFWKDFSIFQYRGDFESCVRQLMNGSTLFSPYWPHVKEAWQKRHHPNVHFVFYEDLKADTMLELRKLNDFLGTRLSEVKLEAVAQHISFSSMKHSGDIHIKKIWGEAKLDKTSFFRKGTTGDWKYHFSPELQEEVDRWIEKNVADTDISLRWALWQ